MFGLLLKVPEIAKLTLRKKAITGLLCKSICVFNL